MIPQFRMSNAECRNERRFLHSSFRILHSSTARWIFAGCIVLLAGMSVAQNWSWRRRFSEGPFVQTEGGETVNEDTVRTARETAEHSTPTPNWTNAPGFEHDTFTFARVVYRQNHVPVPSWLGWINDYPDSDLNLSFRLQQLTSMKVDPDGRVLKLTNPDLSRYPFIYMVQAGHMMLTDEEIPILRAYLQNGGVLMADDFWGDRDWARFEAEIRRVFPGRAWTELPMDHPIFHCVFDLNVPRNHLQVPTIQFWEPGGITYRGTDDTREFHLRAWLDDHGRIMVVATHNTDNGDGWEREGESEDYFRAFSEPRAYPLAINILFYVMTH